MNVLSPTHIPLKTIKDISKKLNNCKANPIIINHQGVFLPNNQLLHDLPDTQQRVPYLEIQQDGKINRSQWEWFLRTLLTNDHSLTAKVREMDIPFQSLTLSRHEFIYYLEILISFVEEDEKFVYILDHSTGNKRRFVPKKPNQLSEQQIILLKLLQNETPQNDVEEQKHKLDRWAIASLSRHIASQLFYRFLKTHYDDSGIIDIISARDRRADNKKSIIEITYKKQLLRDYLRDQLPPSFSSLIDILVNHYLFLDPSHVNEDDEKRHIRSLVNYLLREKPLFSERGQNALKNLAKGGQLSGSVSDTLWRTNTDSIDPNERERIATLLSSLF